MKFHCLVLEENPLIKVNLIKNTETLFIPLKKLKSNERWPPGREQAGRRPQWPSLGPNPGRYLVVSPAATSPARPRHRWSLERIGNPLLLLPRLKPCVCVCRHSVPRALVNGIVFMRLCQLSESWWSFRSLPSAQMYLLQVSSCGKPSASTFIGLIKASLKLQNVIYINFFF